MGIKNLNRILKDHIKPNTCIRNVPLSTYQGQKLAIDINIYLHRFAYNSAHKKKNSHIDGFFMIIYDLLKNNILPV